MTKPGLNAKPRGPCYPPTRASALVLLSLLISAIAGGVTAGPLGGDFILTDDQGQPYDLRQTRGQVVILSFGYTACPDICPTTLAILTEALRQLGDMADQVQPLFVSLDPDRDRPERLGPYVRYFHPRLIGLTGTPEALRAVADRYGVRYAFAGKGEREDYSLDHSASIYILDGAGTLVRIIPYGLPAEAITESLRDLLSDSASPTEAE